jgi:hypothetical protein
MSIITVEWKDNELAHHAKSVFLDAANMLPDINHLRILQLS